MSEKIIHFGEFIRWKRINSGKTTEEFGREIGLTARRVIAIEAMATPDVQHTTLVALAKAFEIDPEAFNSVWRNTPVPVTKRKVGPTTDEARRFGIACAAAGINQAQGLRRLRSWLVAQDPETQHTVLSFEHGESSSDATFTDLVDHLQDPADAARKRVGQKATNSARSPGSASTSADKHR